MKEIKIHIITVLLVFNVLGLMGQTQTVINFNTCPGNTGLCNAFYPQFVCNGISQRTMYGGPELYNYSYTDFSGNPATNQVVKLTGMKKTVNGIVLDADEGFEFEYIFKPNRNYVISVFASGLTDQFGNTVIATGEVILGSQYSTQNIAGCDPDIFDFTKNNGTPILGFTPTKFTPETFQAVYTTSDANLSKVKVRCINTATNQSAGTARSYLLIYHVIVTEGATTDPNDNRCMGTHIHIPHNIIWDYANPTPGEIPPYIYSSFYSTTAARTVHISNGGYLIVSNRDIYLKPGFHGSIGTNGLIKAAIGRCKDGAPLRVATGQNAEEPQSQENKPDEQDLNSNTILFPNPASTELKIVLKEDIPINQIFVSDNLGRRVGCRISKSDRNKLKLDVTALKNGIYYINIGSLGTYKFVVFR